LEKGKPAVGNDGLKLFGRKQGKVFSMEQNRTGKACSKFCWDELCVSSMCSMSYCGSKKLPLASLLKICDEPTGTF
jgi:hypothetical protein